MSNSPVSISCPECDRGPSASPILGRRQFIRVIGSAAASVAIGSGITPLSPLARARAARAEKQAQAESLIFDLFATMDSDQKQKLVFPWDAGSNGGKKLAERLQTHNAPVGKSVIGLEYTKKQVEILDRIFHSISNGEKGYKQLSRNGKFDNSGDFESIGARIYGEPVAGKKFSLVFSGHHLTLRCDGNSEEQAAFGGPLYYGHSPSGYAPTNVFNNQTKIVDEVYQSLSAVQRTSGVKPGKWQDGVESVKLPGKRAKLPGLMFQDMSKDQKVLVENVMRELISPYRKEDGDEVMEIVKLNGGMEKMALAFYQEGEVTAKEQWTFWRLEGPGFVWSFRVLPHIHTFVNISSKIV